MSLTPSETRDFCPFLNHFFPQNTVILYTIICVFSNTKWSACRGVTVRAKRNSSTHRALSEPLPRLPLPLDYEAKGSPCEAKSACMEGSAVRRTHTSTDYNEIAQKSLLKEQSCRKYCLLTKTSTSSKWGASSKPAPMRRRVHDGHPLPQHPHRRHQS